MADPSVSPDATRPPLFDDVFVDLPIRRAWAMPNPYTFEIAPIAELLDRWLTGKRVIVDPFCGRSTRGTHRNDLALGGVNAQDYCQCLSDLRIVADAVLFDPPYSPRQISECYKAIGLQVGIEETQNARLYKCAKDWLDRLAAPGAVAICCGWNSAGFGKKRGWRLEEILLVAHGGAHNDTIVTVERKA